MQRLWIRHGPNNRFDVVVTTLGTVVRMVVAAFGVVFVVGAVSVGSQSTSGVGALWFFVAGIATVTSWIVWDVVKSWGALPAARLTAHDGEIAFSTPFWQRSFTAATLRAGSEVRLLVREYPIIPAGKTMYVYEFRQGERAVRYLAPAPIKDQSMTELREALAAADCSLSVEHSPPHSRRGKSRAARNLDS